MISKTIFFAVVTLLIATIVSGKSTGRIVGGSMISIEMVPYQVSIQYSDIRKRKSHHFCGGSIISENFVLTAGHCTEDRTRENLIVVVGAKFHDRGGKRITVERIINNPNYDTITQDYDIALLELSEKLKYSDSIKPIALPNDDEVVSPGIMCLVSGYGDQKRYPLSKRTELRAVEVPVVDFKKCNINYRMFDGITPRMMCAGFEQGGKDACQGDSGGPLACSSKVRSGNQTLYGITSWGDECAAPGYPGVYTDVRVLRAWIREQAGL